jgi:purine-binding chemotaxis protein CheW
MTQLTTRPAQNCAPVPVLQPASEHGQYLIFTLSGEAFAIDILHVKEIIEYGQLTEVPMMPEVVRGVINLRGAVVPVIDLSARFGRSPTPIARRTCIVIVELAHDGERHDVGIIVDAVNEVLDIAPADIDPPPSFGTHMRSDFISGMAKIEGRFVIVLNAEKVLCLQELSLEAAQSERTGPT